MEKNALISAIKMKNALFVDNGTSVGIFTSYMVGGEVRRRRRGEETQIKAVSSRSSLYRDDLPTISAFIIPPPPVAVRSKGIGVRERGGVGVWVRC